jgi:murein DD-endopeptidase MepM/ murein hydrolase activator NlpD
MRLLLALLLMLTPIQPPAGQQWRRVAPAVSYRWPLDGRPTVVRPFQPPPQPWLPGHRGVDLGAPPGATVRSAGPGVVAFAGMVAGRPVVSVEHPGGLRTTYEPVQPLVRAGQTVEAGTALGTLLAGHNGALHWGLRRGPVYLDPLSLLGLARVRLLPADSPQHGPASPLQKLRQAGREPLVLLRPVVDLGRQPQEALAFPGADGDLGRQLLGNAAA